MDFTPIYKTYEQINSDVESFLNAYHPTLSIPVPIEEIIELKLDIDIIPIPGLKNSTEQVGLHIDAFIASNFKSISVDQYTWEHFQNRYRFSLAHEIAHMFMHAYLYAEFHFYTTDEWIQAINETPLIKRGIVESQANDFAGLILVPKRALKDEFEVVVKEIEAKSGLLFHDHRDVIVDTAIYLLAPRFGVSDDTIRIRLEKDGLK